MSLLLYLILSTAVLGAIVGSFLNVCIYRLPLQKSVLWPLRSYCPRCLHPVRARDNIPIVSWWMLHGRCRDCGERFSVRYMLVELFTAALFALVLWVYWPIAPAGLWRYGYHLVLLAALIVATFIDLDLQIIPDSVTVPGMLLGLAGGFVLPAFAAVHPLPLAQPAPDPPWAHPVAHLVLLVIGWAFWLAGLAGQRARFYGPPGPAPVVFLAAAFVYLALQTAAFVLVPRQPDWPGWSPWLAMHPRWQGLGTSLIGLLVGAGLVWVVRVLGTAALGKEAMGFGDVTLMGMVGAFLGWQPAVLIFFLAPFFGLLVGIVQWIVRGENVLPYGPYLSLAALVVLLFWPAIWSLAEGHFVLLGMIPPVIPVAVLLPILILAFWRNWRHRAKLFG